MSNNTQIIDIDLSMTEKKKFRINGDDNRILLLDTSDLTMLTRLESVYSDLNNMMDDVSSKIESVNTEADDESKIKSAIEALKVIDDKMRGLIDYIFDSNVSDICAPSGTMYDMFNGTFRWEHIIDNLTKLYEANLNKEYKLMKSRMSKHTSKYTKK